MKCTSMNSQYLKEIKYLRLYIISLSIAITSSYSIYFFLDDAYIEDLGREDHLFENLTAVFLFLGSILYFLSFNTSGRKYYFLFLMALLLFFGGGEEISWGQRIFHFITPAKMGAVNVQREVSVHNLEIFNHKNFDATTKHGWHRLLEMNFLFRIFCGVFGFVFPLCTFHLKPVNRLMRSLKVPIPPINIGIFFILSWLVFRWILAIIPQDRSDQYYDTATEIFEFLSSYVLLLTSIYFYKNRKEDILGYDIKQFI